MEVITLSGVDIGFKKQRYVETLRKALSQTAPGSFNAHIVKNALNLYGIIILMNILNLLKKENKWNDNNIRRFNL